MPGGTRPSRKIHKNKTLNRDSDQTDPISLEELGMASAQYSDRAMDEWLTFAIELSDTAHAMLAPAGRIRPDAVVKPDRSFVTALDGEIEERLRGMIEERFPHHGILGEERGPSRLDAEMVWILDPIDGTAPFITGVPVYGTLISLAVRGEPVLGIIQQAATPDRWIGARGRPTLHTAGPCRTRPCTDLAQAILTASNPDFFAADERPALDALRQATAWRIYGGCCMSYGLLASGRTDVAIDTGFKIYDYAPFVPIIEGAGGVITDWEGKPLTLTSGPRVLAAGDPARHRDALRLVERAMARGIPTTGGAS
jgi:inositol-phosphate phosphatase / L-galactose 1-phosphate phosphatase / histidinol-phosphatase